MLGGRLQRGLPHRFGQTSRGSRGGTAQILLNNAGSGKIAVVSVSFMPARASDTVADFLIVPFSPSRVFGGSFTKVLWDKTTLQNQWRVASIAFFGDAGECVWGPPTLSVGSSNMATRVTSKWGFMAIPAPCGLSAQLEGPVGTVHGLEAN